MNYKTKLKPGKLYKIRRQLLRPKQSGYSSHGYIQKDSILLLTKKEDTHYGVCMYFMLKNEQFKINFDGSLIDSFLKGI